MTYKEAIKIIEDYWFYEGGKVALGQDCINENYLYAKKHFDEANKLINELVDKATSGLED